MLSSDRIQSLVETDETLAILNAAISKDSSPADMYLKELGAKGIPLIVVDRPGLDSALHAEFYTVDSLIEMIDRARQIETAGL